MHTDAYRIHGIRYLNGVFFSHFFVVLWQKTDNAHLSFMTKIRINFPFTWYTIYMIQNTNLLICHFRYHTHSRFDSFFITILSCRWEIYELIAIIVDCWLLLSWKMYGQKLTMTNNRVIAPVVKHTGLTTCCDLRLFLFGCH